MKFWFTSKASARTADALAIFRKASGATQRRNAFVPFGRFGGRVQVVGNFLLVI